MSDSPSLFQRATSGIKGFFSHAFGYFPRGVVFTGFIFAASAILETQTGISGLGISQADNVGLLAKGMTHLAFGSLISGVIGAGVSCATCKNSNAPGAGLAANLPGQAQSATPGLGQGLVQAVGETGLTQAAEHVFTGSGLPPAAAKLAGHAAGALMK